MKNQATRHADLIRQQERKRQVGREWAVIGFGLVAAAITLIHAHLA